MITEKLTEAIAGMREYKETPEVRRAIAATEGALQDWNDALAAGIPPDAPGAAAETQALPGREPQESLDPEPEPAGGEGGAE